MKKIRLALAFAAALTISASFLPADAAHRCGLEDVSHTVNAICDNYHSPKVVVQYVACIAVGDCPIG